MNTFPVRQRGKKTEKKSRGNGKSGKRQNDAFPKNRPPTSFPARRKRKTGGFQAVKKGGNREASAASHCKKNVTLLGLTGTNPPGGRKEPQGKESHGKTTPISR